MNLSWRSGTESESDGPLLCRDSAGLSYQHIKTILNRAKTTRRRKIIRPEPCQMYGGHICVLHIYPLPKKKKKSSNEYARQFWELPYPSYSVSDHLYDLDMALGGTGGISTRYKCTTVSAIYRAIMSIDPTCGVTVGYARDGRSCRDKVRWKRCDEDYLDFHLLPSIAPNTHHPSSRQSALQRRKSKKKKERKYGFLFQHPGKARQLRAGIVLLSLEARPHPKRDDPRALTALPSRNDPR